MLKIYPAIFHPDTEVGGYWVSFPDLPGCVTEGDSLEQAMAMAQEALGLYLAVRLEDKLETAEPSNIKDIDPEDGFVNYVSAEINKYRRKTKAVRKTLTIPEWLNEEAEKRHINFSKLLQEALIQEMGV